VNVAAIMPCRGRPEQTVRNVKRLLSTAGYPFQLICVGGKDEHALLDQLAALGATVLKSDAPRVTYWQALAGATQQTDAQLLVNLANDLIPGQHWLKRAIEGYQEAFGDAPGLLGFNGDSWGVEHSCHFLIHRVLLDRYGGWPVHYDHAFGDTELCQRAIADKAYAKAPWALLFHDHVYFGGKDDAVYAEGRKAVSRDEQLYLERKRRGWPTISPT
jgi:hypothetical protein